MSDQKYIVLNGQLYRKADSSSENRLVAAIWEPSKGDPDITVEKLTDSFPEFDEKEAAAFVEKLDGVHDGNFNEILRAADEMIDAFGVEALELDERECQKYDCDWDDREIAYYINTGDTYSATLLYDPEDNRVYLTTWGDWKQAWERQKEKEAASEEDE